MINATPDGSLAHDRAGDLRWASHRRGAGDVRGVSMAAKKTYFLRVDPGAASLPYDIDVEKDFASELESRLGNVAIDEADKSMAAGVYENVAPPGGSTLVPAGKVMDLTARSKAREALKAALERHLERHGLKGKVYKETDGTLTLRINFKAPLGKQPKWQKAKGK